MLILASLFGAMGLWIFEAGPAHACSCEQISPAEGFDRAQYVFSGRIAETSGHTWVVDVNRVWKGADRLAGQVRLLDVYAMIDCEFFFAMGRDYLFFADVAKSSRYVYYQPQVCNWTSALQSKRIPHPEGGFEWLEDFMTRRYGPGQPPMAQDPWNRAPRSDGTP
jgi:hypothetical protein